jgi:glutathione-regulated potassium-efflux system ancillary protein KefG
MQENARPHNVVVLFFHPRYEDSRANRLLAEAAQATPGVLFRDMYELYPDFAIDVAQEKSILLAHDIITWQHPFFWYSCPPLMKQWIDLVLEYGWAYGKNGDKLAGKSVLQAVTSGGTFDVYQTGGRNRFTYRTLLSPFDQTVHLCQMQYLPPFIVPGASRLPTSEIDRYAQRYAAVLRGLQAGQWPGEQLASSDYFNQLID